MTSSSKMKPDIQTCVTNQEHPENSIKIIDAETNLTSVSVISETTCDKTPECNAITKLTRKIDVNKITRSMTALFLTPKNKFPYNKYVLFSIKKDSEFLLLYKINNKKKEIKNEHKKQKVIENKKNKDNIENKKVNKVDEYSQVYKKNDFKDKPPKLPQLYFRDYLYENKNIFSNLNGSIGDININKNVKNSFYNHLMINKNDNKSNYLITSVNRRVCAKLFTYIYYSP